MLFIQTCSWNKIKCDTSPTTFQSKSSIFEIDTLNLRFPYTVKFCIESFDKLQCCHNHHLTYIGSFEKYHLFFCWDKVTDNKDRCQGFAVLKEEFRPEREYEYSARDSIPMNMRNQPVKK